MKVLGVDLGWHTCTLADKNSNKRLKLSLICTIRELQSVLRILLWASSFVPDYKDSVRPIEALIAQGEHAWMQKYTDA